MVKRVFFIFLLSLYTLHAASFYKEIENVVGKNTYIANKKIIKTLFKQQQQFYKNGHIDYIKVLSVLKNNNLLNVKISRSTAINLSFATRQRHPVAFIKLIKSTLNELGYSRIDIQKVIQDKSGFMYKVVVYSDSAPDPMMIVENFAKKSASIVKVKRFSISNWRYFVDISHLDLVEDNVPYRKKVRLPKPLEPYWIDVSNVKVVVINSSKSNRWYPKIVFYDSFLNIVNNFSKDIKSYNIRLEVPRNASYMKVSDLYTLDNISRGLTIYLANKK